MTAAGRERGTAPLAEDDVLVGFKSHLWPMVVPDDAAYLVSRRGVTALHGAEAEILVPLLDGTRTLGAVRREASTDLGPDDVEAALRALAGAGLIRSIPPAGAAAGNADAEAYFDLAGLDGGRAAAALAGSAVTVEALTGVDAEPVAEACRASGVTVTEDPLAAGLALVLCDDYLSPGLADVGAAHRAAGRPWLLAKLCGTDPWVGPFFHPDSGPCWHCMAVRVRGHRHSELPVRRALGLDGPVPRPPAGLAAGLALAANLAALESAKWLAGMRTAEQGHIQTLDTVRLRTASHPVSRLPQCAGCGDPGLVARRGRAPFVPVPRAKAVSAGGGDRALSPAQMLQRYGHLVDPVTGVVKEIRRTPGTPDFVNSYISGHNLAMESATYAGLSSGLRALNGGKGLTDEEARTSALCEAVERYSGTRHGDEPVVRDSLRGLGAVALHPNASQLYDRRQYAEREYWNAQHSRFHYVSTPFDENRPTDWTPVWSLTEGVQRLLPTSMLYFARGDARPAGTPGAPADGLWADSNGNAAGSSPEDALIQGFLELVERDAVALWWYNRTRQPGVDLAAFDEEWIGRVRDGYRRAHREMWVLDLTSDLGIPVMAALSRRTDKPEQDVIFGFGAHFDPRVALRRALTEMGQLLPAVSGVRPDGSGYRITDPEPLSWWHLATVANQPYLAADPTVAPRTPRDWQAVPGGDLRDDVHRITELVSNKGMDLLVVDQTRPDLNLPVVKVIVPGLRHFWARYAPGRLFDVPVALGRLAEPTPYDQLNPIPLFV
ncbi:TOMM precursor leader peptide-binding protein [Streptomyces sp. ISL-86]|uniref:TOMM precursor leader peptide-binding protein n=1 Tax=Streptomyces sp. ISL-86 TaxID=2819187 RepID=UPI001BEB897C|nr:TOMM precursor leader peptide-binding protein [Streptomyces sp. ISL-86]MBT2454393.1 TOMM precursor leader peptide-binding protein [Streptomyces sp. ISL-86]